MGEQWRRRKRVREGAEELYRKRGERDEEGGK